MRYTGVNEIIKNYPSSLIKEDGRYTITYHTNGKGYFKDLDGILLLDDRIKTIDKIAFAGTDKLKALYVLKGVDTIDSFSFQNCTGLEKVVIGDVSKIGNGVFARCAFLKHVTLMGNNVDIGDDIFYGCTNLGSITYVGNNENIINKLRSMVESMQKKGYLVDLIVEKTKEKIKK